MELFLRKLAFEQIGMHALSAVPFSKQLLDWELGLPSTRDLPFSFGEAILPSRYGSDITPYVLQSLSFLDAGLDEIEQATTFLAERIERCRRSLENDVRLSHRQQKFILSFLENPAAHIDCATYGKENGVTLVTARSDLKKLVRLGYLSMAEHGKKQVFFPVARLDKVILRN